MISLTLCFQDKFLRDTFDTLDFTAVPIETFEKGLDDIGKEKEISERMPNVQQGGMSRLSISSRFLSRSQQANMR